MKKAFSAAVLLACTLGVGYGIGQLSGVSLSSAASSAPTPTTQLPPDGAHGPQGGWGNLGPRADGVVTAVNGDIVTVKADSDQGQTGEYVKVTTIQLSSSTQYGADRETGAAGSKAAIKVGSYIIAKGTLSADGASLAASTVQLHADGGYFRGGADGAGSPDGPGSGSTGPGA
jgi:hypothetical protein